MYVTLIGQLQNVSKYHVRICNYYGVLVIIVIECQEKFEDTKEETRSRKSKKDRHYNYKEKRKRTNNDL